MTTDREVYADPDAAAVTQLTDGVPSSSLPCQSVVVDMLAALQLAPEHRTLELGTGTGWNAALLARQAGPDRVTSVEADPGSAARAAERLAAHGLHCVSVETGDGCAGSPGGAPYDRTIATYAVERVPWAWVAGTRPGGRIVFPWGRLGHFALTVAEDGGSATGRVRGLAQFMPARGAAAATRGGFGAVRGDGPAESEHTVTGDLSPLHDSWHLHFALRVALPEVEFTTAVDEDGVNAWLHDGTSSWAVLSARPGPTTVVHQGGPRRLAAELRSAWQNWVSRGSPDLDDFGMTVEPGRQYIWLHGPVTGPRRPTG